jgi:hypothetical protein
MCMVEHQLTDSCSRVQYDLVALLRLVKIWFDHTHTRVQISERT